jgi:tetratricopeptide (TPR) repeat protein
MTNFIVALLCLVIFANSTYAQMSYVGNDSKLKENTAINIAVSKFESESGDIIFDQAESQEKKGDFNEALTLYGKAAFEYNVLKNYNKYGQSIMKMGLMHYQLGRYIDAEQILINVALKNYSKMGSKSGMMTTYYQLGKVYYAANKYTQSLWFYTQQGILAQQLKNNFSYIESILGIAQVKIKKGDLTLAGRDVNRAEFLASSIKTPQYKDYIKDLRAQINTKVIAKK